jgi:hypothetical protein
VLPDATRPRKILLNRKVRSENEKTNRFADGRLCSQHFRPLAPQQAQNRLIKKRLPMYPDIRQL